MDAYQRRNEVEATIGVHDDVVTALGIIVGVRAHEGLEVLNRSATPAPDGQLFLRGLWRQTVMDRVVAMQASILLAQALDMEQGFL